MSRFADTPGGASSNYNATGSSGEPSLMHQKRVGQLVALLSIAAAVVVCSPKLHARGDDQIVPAAPPWTWIDGTDHRRTRAEFDAIVAQHGLWLKTTGAQGVRAVLPNAKL